MPAAGSPELPERVICPGERVPISRAVHHARIEAGFAACRDCHWNRDCSSSTPTSDRLTLSIPDGTPAERQGVRGLFRNDIDATAVREAAMRFFSQLWLHRDHEQPPQVIIAHDERESGPELLIAAVTAAERSGVRFRLLENATTATVRFFAAYHRTDGFFHITGAGAGPGWTGWEIGGQNGEPIEFDGLLAFGSGSSAHRTGFGSLRQTRSAGVSLSPCDRGDEHGWIAEGLSFSHPMRIGFGPATASQREVISGAIAHSLIVPEWISAVDEDDFASRTKARRCGCGFRFDADGERMTVFDERGYRVDAVAVAVMVSASRIERTGQRGSVSIPAERLYRTPSADVGSVEVIEEERSAMWSALRSGERSLALDPTDRLWSAERFDWGDETSTEPVPQAHAVRLALEALDGLAQSRMRWSDYLDTCRSRL